MGVIKIDWNKKKFRLTLTYTRAVFISVMSQDKLIVISSNLPKG